MKATVNRSTDKSLKCLSLGNEAYSNAKEMAKAEMFSVSAYLRNLIKKTYIKWSRNKVQQERGVKE